jgi:Fur family transcriptional regulator, peroxide stress response regulator
VVVSNEVLFKEIAPHDFIQICRQLPCSSQNPASATVETFDVEEQRDGHSMRKLNTASVSFLLAAAMKRTSLDKMLH